MGVGCNFVKCLRVWNDLCVLEVPWIKCKGFQMLGWVSQFVVEVAGVELKRKWTETWTTSCLEEDLLGVHKFRWQIYTKESEKRTMSKDTWLPCTSKLIMTWSTGMAQFTCHILQDQSKLFAFCQWVRVFICRSCVVLKLNVMASRHSNTFQRKWCVLINDWVKCDRAGDSFCFW